MIIHRIAIFSLLAISLGWSCFALKINPLELALQFRYFELLSFSYVVMLTVVFWPIAYIELCDIVCSAQGKNGKIYLGYFKSMKSDILISSLSAAALMSIYILDGVDYNFSGIDLGFTGAPFILSALLKINEMRKKKIAGTTVNKAPIFIMFFVAMAWAFFSYKLLLTNSSGKLSTESAIWYQITILLGSFYFYTSASLQLYLLDSQKFELSSFKLHILKNVLKSKFGFYESLGGQFDKINNSIKKAKAEERKKRKNGKR